MKARIKKTGEVIKLVDDRKLSLLDYARGIYMDACTGKKYHFRELDFIEEPPAKDIDWEQRRYEIAKEILPNAKYYQRYRSDGLLHNLTMEESVKVAVLYADALIAELKKGGAE